VLRTRVIVAAIALPLLIAVVIIGGWLFAALVLAVLVLAGNEYIRLMRQDQNNFRPYAWLTLALIVLALGSTWFEHPGWRDAGLTLLIIVGLAYAVWEMEHGVPRPFTNLALAAMGGIYLGWLGRTLLAVRLLDDGAALVLVLYSCVVVSDSAAYFVGRRLGRHQLSPRVSPKKTWEGYLGGVIGGLLCGGLAASLAGVESLTVGHGALIGLLIGVLGTVGDLGESVIKRQVGAKDSSHLIPGHGGMLDRLDSVLVSAAIGYYYLVWFVK
jgi:phosphatidate cytidylyltransferase